MKKGIVMAAVAMMVLAASCTSVRYMGPDYVDSRMDGTPKMVEQRSYGREVFDETRPTYDEEFFYTADGKIIKVRQTEYVNTKDEAKKEFIVWETEYKAMGGKIVPWKLTVNGDTYLEIEYEILGAKNEGEVKQRSLNRRFYQKITQMLFMTTVYTNYSWDMSLSILPMPFASDGEFVSTKIKADGSFEKTLTLGWDNIVVKSVKYDPQARLVGIAKTSKTYKTGLSTIVTRSSNANFTYEWEVIAGKICQTSMKYNGKETGYTGMGPINLDVNFTAETSYDKFGNRTAETWYLIDSKKNNEKIVLFEEKLTY